LESQLRRRDERIAALERQVAQLTEQVAPLSKMLRADLSSPAAHGAGATGTDHRRADDAGDESAPKGAPKSSRSSASKRDSVRDSVDENDSREVRENTTKTETTSALTCVMMN